MRGTQSLLWPPLSTKTCSKPSETCAICPLHLTHMYGLHACIAWGLWVFIIQQYPTPKTCSSVTSLDGMQLFLFLFTSAIFAIWLIPLNQPVTAASTCIAFAAFGFGNM